MRSHFWTTLAVAVVALPACADAQPRPSQHGGVFQEVNTTTISLEFDRPVLRGRSVFGDILDYDAVWTPGANRTTWIEFSEPVTVEGQSVAAGRYGIWTVPHEGEPWEVVLTSEWDTHHSYFPFESEVIRVRAEPEEGAHMEVLNWYFPDVGPYETTLCFHWGDLVVPLRIEVAR